MDLERFRRSPAGRLVKAPKGYFAFVPHPLPPRLAWSEELVALLSAADRALGRLAGVGERLPNADLLVMPYMRREAVLSSKIEGTQATLSDLLFLEAGRRGESARRGDVLEVSNYVEACARGLGRLAQLPLGLELVRELHATLMAGVRGGQSRPGELRRTQNWIGPPGCGLAECTYVPPPPAELEAVLGAWEGYLQGRDSTPPLIKCALLHYQFEAIHPFIDGNGRIGRLLITLFLCAEGCLPQPLLYLSAFFEGRRTEYYRRLLEVSRDGDWEGWIGFFLRGVAQQAADAFERSSRILALREAWRERLQAQGAPAAALQLLDLVFVSPLVSIPRAAKALGVTYPTAKAAVDRLREAAVLRPYSAGQKWGRLFLARELFELVSAPNLS